MAVIKPFKALRPAAQLAKQVASRPYDVLNTQEAKIEAQGNPCSFLHITKSEIDLPPDQTDINSQTVYDVAKENLTAFIKRNVLFKENKDCYYIYRLIMPDPENTANSRSQTGLVCVSSVEDYENGIIKKHEFTRPEKEQDRINHIQITGAQTGNVFLAYRNVNTIDELIDKWVNTKNAVYDFITDDKIQHTIWIVNDSDIRRKITTIFASEVACTYIADGHHRAASAAKVKELLGKQATETANYFLTTLFPSAQLHIMSYNRVIKDLNNNSAQEFLEQLETDFTVKKIGIKAYQPKTLHQFGMYLANTWYQLTAKQGTYANDPVGILDVTILQNNILNKLLGIQDQRTDKRIDFVGGIRGLSELEKRVNSGEMAVAFSLYPVSIDQLFTIADSGNVMPPKSTWFEPKLRDGLLTHLIYE
jgi:uncharacterized protein (DUF1015 family)